MKARNAWSAILAMALYALPLHAAEPAATTGPPPLRMAQTEAMAYPLLTVGTGNKASGGFLKDLGDLIAAELGTRAEHRLVSRRRIEGTVMSGEADMVCYYSPLWIKGGGENWSVPVVPQIERVVSLAARPLAYENPTDLLGRRVTVLLGYQFPELQAAFASGQVTRLDENHVDLLFRRLRLGMADALITSEVEIAGYFKRFPQERELFSVSTRQFSVTDTQCLVSPASPWRLSAINEALTRLGQNGSLSRLARSYGMSSNSSGR